MNIKSPLALAIPLISACLAAGCTGSDSGKTSVRPAVRGISAGDAQALAAQRSGFDSSQDPPLAAATHFAAGQLAESQNLPTGAIEQYRAALKIDPRHTPSLYRLGFLYAQAHAFDEAIATWKQYLSIAGGNANDYATGCANLGFCYDLAGRTGDAESAFRDGIARDPKNNPCRVNYGLMLARLNRTNEAILQLQAVLPEAQVHYNLASVYEMIGRTQQASAEYRKALELDPGLQDARTRMAALEAAPSE